MKKQTSILTLLAVAAFGVSALGASTAAQARDVAWSVGISSPGVQLGVSNGPGVYQRPVVIAAPQTYYSQPQTYPQTYYSQPQTYYSQPQVIYTQPQVIYTQPPVVYPQPYYVNSIYVPPVYYPAWGHHHGGWDHGRHWR